MEEELTFEQLISNYGAYKLIPYNELLDCLEWKQKRNQILKRDNEQCRSCNKKGTDTVFAPGSKPIHLYEDLLEFEYEDNHGIPRIGIKTVMKRADAPVHLQVHHTYYYFDTCPWDYSDESLITLCSNCHFDAHQSSLIKWFDKNDNFRYLTPCPRCSGVGRLPQYSHVQNGVCFYCKGNMYVELMR